MVSSRRFQIALPFDGEACDRWVRGRRAAWLVGLAGAALLVLAAVLQNAASAPTAWVGLVVLVCGLVGGAVDGSRHGIRVAQTREGGLVVKGVPPTFAASVRHSRPEPDRIR